MWRRWGSVVMCLAVLATAACQRGEDGTRDTTATMLDGAPGDTAQPASPLTDANILALLDHANLADSAAGAIAADKGTSSGVRTFGRQMVREHHDLRAEGERLAKSLRLTPTLPIGDESVGELEETLTLLNTAARGRDFDKAYVDHEVSYHLDVLETATTAMELARATELQQFIQKLAPILQAHLDRAQALQREMR
jgi:putative membrane protein